MTAVLNDAQPLRHLCCSSRRAGQVRMLAMDDDRQTLRHVRDALLKSDYTPIVTPDPEEALRLEEEERPHLVLLDVVLLGADGMELMKEIVKQGAGANHLLVGPRQGASSWPESLDMGAADYLV